MGMKLPDELDFIRAGRLPQKVSLKRAGNKVVMITGATSGVGYAAAMQFAKMGATLILLVRNSEKGTSVRKMIESSTDGRCKLYTADLSSLSEVAAALEQIKSDFSKIDILINNAGAFRTRKKLTTDHIDAVYTVNHLSSFLITINLVPLLSRSASPVVLNINSEGHRFGNVRFNDLAWKKRIYTGLRSYGASKSAQLHCMHILKKELEKFGIMLNSMHPGAVRSKIDSKSGWLYKAYYKIVVTPFLKDPHISADAIYYLATSDDMKGVNGRFFNLTNEEKPAPHAQESAFSEEVYLHTMNLINGFLDRSVLDPMFRFKTIDSSK
jgi:NAD(P)-dependent dehydrogenase (short-subunit alcohol dehydrogenase family)